MVLDLRSWLENGSLDYVPGKQWRPKGFVFLLGAGASAEAGIPTSDQMLRKLRNEPSLSEDEIRLLDQVGKIKDMSKH